MRYFIIKKINDSRGDGHGTKHSSDLPEFFYVVASSTPEAMNLVPNGIGGRKIVNEFSEPEKFVVAQDAYHGGNQFSIEDLNVTSPTIIRKGKLMFAC